MSLSTYQHRHRKFLPVTILIPRPSDKPSLLRRAITESLSVDVRSIRKTREALTSPSCFLLFDGLRVEFATTAAAAAPCSPFPTAASDAVTHGVTPSEKQGSSMASTDSAVDLGSRRHGHEDGDSASAAGGDRVANGGGTGGLAPPPFLPSVETVRVLSVEVAERDSSSAC